MSGYDLRPNPAALGIEPQQPLEDPVDKADEPPLAPAEARPARGARVRAAATVCVAPAILGAFLLLVGSIMYTVWAWRFGRPAGYAPMEA